jgi:hypothetical protein
MKESCAVFEHQQPSKVKKRSPSESEPRDAKSMLSKETAWMSESCKLPEIRFVRKAAKSVRRSIKGEYRCGYVKISNSYYVCSE